MSYLWILHQYSFNITSMCRGLSRLVIKDTNRRHFDMCKFALDHADVPRNHGLSLDWALQYFAVVWKPENPLFEI